MDITLTFHFQSDEAATIATETLAASYGYDPANHGDDKLAFVKAQVADGLKQRIVTYTQEQARREAIIRASAAVGAALEGTRIE